MTPLKREHIYIYPQSEAKEVKYSSQVNLEEMNNYAYSMSEASCTEIDPQPGLNIDKSLRR